MTRFVQHTKERRGEIIFVVARGEAHIVRAERCAKRMCRGVDASGSEIKIDRVGDLLIQLLLCCDRVGSGGQGDALLIRFFNCSGCDRSDLWAELIKQRRYRRS